MRNADKIANVLQGLSASAFVPKGYVPKTPPVSQPTPVPVSTPKPKAKKPPGPIRKVILPNVAQATSVPFFDISRQGPKRDTGDIFKTEQAAQKEFAEQFPQGTSTATGYGVGPDFFYLPDGSEPEMASLKDLATSKQHAARIAFVDWLKTEQPDVYAEVADMIGSGQLGADDTTAAPAPTLWDKITNAVTSLASIKLQSDILKTNLERAQTGLPPIDAATYAPVVKTQVAVTPEMAAELKAGAMNVGKVAMIGGALLAAWLLLKK